MSMTETVQENSQVQDQHLQIENRGSGSDINSDARRLRDLENYRDKVVEDSFPASDAPSHSPKVSWRQQKDQKKESEH